MKQLPLPFKDSLKTQIKAHNNFIKYVYYSDYGLQNSYYYKKYSWKEAFSLREELKLPYLGTHFITSDITGWVKTYDEMSAIF